MLVSLYTFQLDEFMETCFDSRMGLEDHNEARRMLKELCDFDIGQQEGYSEGRPRVKNGSGNLDNATSIFHSQSQEVKVVLHRFTSYIISHPAVTHAPAQVRRHLHS